MLEWHTPPNTSDEEDTANLNPAAQLTREAREAFNKDDIRRNKMKHYFLKIAATIDMQLADAQRAECEEAQALAKDLKEILQQHCTRHSIGYKPQPKKTPSTLQHSSWAEAAKANLPEHAPELPSRPNHRPQNPAHTNTRQHDKTRVFIRIANQHTARKLAPFAILQKLRTHLPREAQINEVQAVPTGFALVPKDTTAAQQILRAQNIIREIIKDATVEMEEKWITAIIPELPTATQSFEGDLVPITEEMAKNELQLLTGVQLEKTRWSMATVEKKLQRGTLVIACKSENISKLPNRISLFGARCPLIIKKPRVQLRQCHRCWDFHDERYCTRKQRCRLCSSTEHLEASHSCPQGNQDCDCPKKCAKCSGPHAADDPACPAKPSITKGSILKKTRIELTAIRNAQALAQKAKAKESKCQKQSSAETPTDTPTPLYAEQHQT
jgi:hypothetical protein